MPGKQPLTAQAIDAGTFDTSRYEPRDSYGRPYEVEKGGWITLLWDTGSTELGATGNLHRPIMEARTIQVSRARAVQAFHALSAGKRIV